MHASQPTALTEDAVVNTVRAGDAVAFTALVERYRDQLQVHCYRMLGSFDDSEDLVQETLLRAWRSRATFEGRSLLRTWLYRIATNACLNALERAPRRVLPQDVVQPVSATTDTSEARAEPPYAPEVPWLQPYPDSRLEPPAPSETEPEASVVSRETMIAMDRGRWIVQAKDRPVAGRRLMFRRCILVVGILVFVLTR